MKKLNFLTLSSILITYTGFYTVYINDITYTSNILDFIFFVNDTTILNSHKNIISKRNMVNEDLQKVSKGDKL